MLGLHVVHHKAIIDGDAGTLVLGQVPIRVGLADGERFPQVSLAVKLRLARNRIRLRIDIHYAPTQRVVRILGSTVQFIDLAQFPSGLGETTVHVYKLVTVGFRRHIGGQFQFVMVMEWQERILGAGIVPLIVGNAVVVAFKVLDHDIRAQE